MANLSPEQCLLHELLLTIMMEGGNIRRGKHSIAGLPELSISAVTYRYPTTEGEMVSLCCLEMGTNMESKLASIFTVSRGEGAG